MIGSAPPTGDVVFDHALIQQRAAELGLDDEEFADRVGLRLTDLQRHLDASHVSVPRSWTLGWSA